MTAACVMMGPLIDDWHLPKLRSSCRHAAGVCSSRRGVAPGILSNERESGALESRGWQLFHPSKNIE
jgi:hypothetical protein